MVGEVQLAKLVQEMTPKLNVGTYVFVSLSDASILSRSDIICEFKEEEGTTLVLEKSKADTLRLDYEFVSSWITLQIHSSLEAVGLTAVFSTELAKHNVSCNVISGYYHDHIFVAQNDTNKAIQILTDLSKHYK